MPAFIGAQAVGALVGAGLLTALYPNATAAAGHVVVEHAGQRHGTDP
jgi:hypothetical protein